jgi:hypothetical protein
VGGLFQTSALPPRLAGEDWGLPLSPWRERGFGSRLLERSLALIWRPMAEICRSLHYRPLGLAVVIPSSPLPCKIGPMNAREAREGIRVRPRGDQSQKQLLRLLVALGFSRKVL